MDGGDTHSDNFEGTALKVADLQAKGLLGQTLVVLGTEFGRTLRINDNDERDRVFIHRGARYPIGYGWGPGDRS